MRKTVLNTGEHLQQNGDHTIVGIIKSISSKLTKKYMNFVNQETTPEEETKEETPAEESKEEVSEESE